MLLFLSWKGWLGQVLGGDEAFLVGLPVSGFPWHQSLHLGEDAVLNPLQSLDPETDLSWISCNTLGKRVHERRFQGLCILVV